MNPFWGVPPQQQQYPPAAQGYPPVVQFPPAAPTMGMQFQQPGQPQMAFPPPQPMAPVSFTFAQQPVTHMNFGGPPQHARPVPSVPAAPAQHAVNPNAPRPGG